MTHPILLPMLSMIGLTLIMGGALAASRLPTLKRLRIHPQAVANRAQMAQAIPDTKFSDNFVNLFEVPVMFYAVCLSATVLNHEPAGLVMAAWAYVGLRAVHSLIHVTTNKVMHRFAAYMSSNAVLIGMTLSVACAAL